MREDNLRLLYQFVQSVQKQKIKIILDKFTPSMAYSSNFYHGNMTRNSNESMPRQDRDLTNNWNASSGILPVSETQNEKVFSETISLTRNLSRENVTNPAVNTTYIQSNFSQPNTNGYLLNMTGNYLLKWMRLETVQIQGPGCGTLNIHSIVVNLTSNNQSFQSQLDVHKHYEVHLHEAESCLLQQMLPNENNALSKMNFVLASLRSIITLLLHHTSLLLLLYSSHSNGGPNLTENGNQTSTDSAKIYTVDTNHIQTEIQFISAKLNITLSSLPFSTFGKSCSTNFPSLIHISTHQTSQNPDSLFTSIVDNMHLEDQLAACEEQIHKTMRSGQNKDLIELYMHLFLDIVLLLAALLTIPTILSSFVKLNRWMANYCLMVEARNDELYNKTMELNTEKALTEKLLYQVNYLCQLSLHYFRMLLYL